MNPRNNTIPITDSTSGISRALAESLRALNHQVIILGHREALLDEVTHANSGMRAALFTAPTVPALPSSRVSSSPTSPS